MSDLDIKQVAFTVRRESNYFGRVHTFEVVRSTQDEAKRLARQGTPEGTLIIAKGQTAGRGREGHRWFSPTGAGLYASTVLRPPAPPERWPSLTVVAGMGLVEGLIRAGLADTRLRWPNDAVVKGMKVAGIICEAEPQDGYVVMGIGVNAYFDGRSVPQEIAMSATALDRHLPPGSDVAAACARVLVSTFARYRLSLPDLKVPADRIEPLLWTRDLVEAGSITGRVVGVSTDGALRIATPGGRIEEVVSGEVRYVGGV